MLADTRQVSWNLVLCAAAAVFPFWSWWMVVRPIAETDSAAAFALVTVVCVVVEALLIPSVRSEVVVDARGIRVLAGPARVPVFVRRLSTVARVERTEVRALHWGGWGLRWRSGETGLILKSGPGVVITSSSGRRFVLTCADPDAVVDRAEAELKP